MRNRTPSSQRGIALVSSLFFATTIMAFAASVIISGYAVEKQKRYIAANQMAQDAAESGVHMLISRMNSPEGSLLRAAGAAEGTMRGTSARAQQFAITMTEAGADAADNDLDGTVDETDEADMIEVSSTGRYDSVVRTVRVTLLARYTDPNINSATYFADPFANLRFNGNAFLLSGYDVDINRVRTGLRVPGVGVNGDPNFIRSNVPGNRENRIEGLGGNPSVYQVDELDLRELIDAGARAANVTLAGTGTNSPSEPGAWGTLDAPAIVYGTGSVHVSGAGTGAGMLIVEGDLHISGAFDWYGVIIVRGEVIFSGGGGGRRVTGALVVEKDLSTVVGNSDQDTELTLNGTIDVLFSEQTIAKVMTQFASYTILNWREGPNPPGDALP
ncbi:MAG: hypothetical protein ACREID_09750 [Planctomycetota bacterium]